MQKHEAMQNFTLHCKSVYLKDIINALNVLNQCCTLAKQSGKIEYLDLQQALNTLNSA